MRALTELEPATFFGKTVILDIDGTLVPERSVKLPEPVRVFVKELAAHSDVYLCSNSHLDQRTLAFAEMLGVKYVESHYRKPRIDIRSVTGTTNELVVIGDKWLTDGRLARRNQARFVKVKHIADKHTPWLAEASYAFDALVYWWVRVFSGA